MTATPNHALQRTAPCVTAPASTAAFPPTMQVPRRTPRSLSLGSLGDFAHLLRVMSANEDIPRPKPPTKLHGLKTSSSRVCSEFGGLAFGSFESIEQPTFPEFAIRESLPSSTASFFGIYRELHASRRSTRTSSTRLGRAAVLGYPTLHASGESHLSRHFCPGVHRESERFSRNSFRASVLNPTSPNHALQRTPGFGVQLPRAAIVRPAQSRAVLPAMKPSTARAFASRRRAATRAPGPESLSLGSLGVLRPLFRE